MRKALKIIAALLLIMFSLAVGLFTYFWFEKEQYVVPEGIWVSDYRVPDNPQLYVDVSYDETHQGIGIYPGMYIDEEGQEHQILIWFENRPKVFFAISDTSANDENEAESSHPIWDPENIIIDGWYRLNKEKTRIFLETSVEYDGYSRIEVIITLTLLDKWRDMPKSEIYPEGLQKNRFVSGRGGRLSLC